MKAVIFDLDGVLVSTDDLHYKAWKALAHKLGILDFNREDNQKQRGIGRMDSLDILLAKSSKNYSHDEKLEMAEFKNNYYVKSLESLSESALLDGALETLKMLKVNKVKIALGSASKNAAAIIEKTGIVHYFDQIACGLDTSKSKPDPEVFLIAAHKLKLAPMDCIVVEDSEAGAMAAHKANMKVLGLGSAIDPDLPDWKAMNLADKSLSWEEMLEA